jgi:branched-chain amino acid transport system substrate-binding protein
MRVGRWTTRFRSEPEQHLTVWLFRRAGVLAGSPTFEQGCLSEDSVAAEQACLRLFNRRGDAAQLRGAFPSVPGKCNVTDPKESRGEGSMFKKAIVASVFAGFLAFGPGAPSAFAAETFDIPVILPLSGGAAFVGMGQRQTLEALEASVNMKGGVDDHLIHFAFYDDQTSPQVAVQLLNQVLAARPAVVLGSSLVAMCSAMAPLMKGGPVLFCLSPGFHPPAGGFAFSSSTSSADQIATVIRYFRMKGLTRLAVLNSTDASGQDGDRAVAAALALPENKGVTLVDHEAFNTTDVSVTAQIEKIKASGAQALIAWTTGAPLATVFKGMIQGGLDIPVAPTSGNEMFAQMDGFSGFLPKQLVLPSALFPQHDGVLALDPQVEKVQHDMYAILKERNLKADNMVATSWDAGLIVIEGLRALGVNASADQLRHYIAGLTNFPGVDGIYDFKRFPERGVGPNASTLVTYDPQGKRWEWLSSPGGKPLPPAPVVQR